MTDQATALRGLIEKRQEQPSGRDETPGRRARTIAVTSGKGGVGKSCLSLNLAVALSQEGKRVCLLDACLGLGNLDLLCGLNAYWNLSHFITGARSLHEIILEGPEGIHVIPGASGLTELADLAEETQDRLIVQMSELEESHDVLIVDTGSGIHRFVRQFAASADQVLVVTMPEPTAIADAYATVKALASSDPPPVALVVNQARSPTEAREVASRIQQTARLFPRTSVRFAGCVRRDRAMPAAVIRQVPCVLDSPASNAAADIRRLARRLVGSEGTPQNGMSYFERFRTSENRKAA